MCDNTNTPLIDQSLILFKYIRGSHAYGLNIETSDIDTCCIYCYDMDTVIGLRHNYQSQIHDERSDNTGYELEKFITLLQKANPNVLEALYVPDSCILYMHPAFKILRDNRDMFLTKACFKSFYSYAKSQVQKARGLNKKIVGNAPHKPTILEFCYTPHRQGSIEILTWLKWHHMNPEYCGCNNLPNMVNAIGVYYDWTEYFYYDFITSPHELTSLYEVVKDHSYDYFLSIYLKQEKLIEIEKTAENPDTNYISMLEPTLDKLSKLNLIAFICKTYDIKTGEQLIEWYNHQKEIYRGYRGIVKMETKGGGIADNIHMSSIIKEDNPICYMTYNINGYSQACARYKDYYDWVDKRNQARYESNLNKSYDSKNMMHCFRLIKMAIEIASGKGFICDRSNIDRDYLLDIRNHKFEYDELITKLDELSAQMDNAIQTCILPDEIDPNIANDILINIRKEFWKSLTK